MGHFSITITGKPNVGKSTLYNKLLQKKHAITCNTEGVTRDYNEDEIKMADGTKIILRDTAGIIISPKTKLDHLINDQTKTAINNADMIFMVTDGSNEIDFRDTEIATMIRKSNKPVYIIVNKCDKKYFDAQKFLKWGFDNIIEIAAEHNIRIDSVKQIIYDNAKRKPMRAEKDDEGKNDPIAISLVGRVNVGKSTMFNKIVREERSIAHNMQCVTRDQISKTIKLMDRDIKITDTPGFKKYSENDMEKIIEATNKILLKKTDIAIIVIDGTEESLLKQDFKVANMLIKSGAIILIAVNKSDMIKNKKALERKIKEAAQTSLSQIYDIKIDMVSALSGFGIKKMIDGAMALYGNSFHDFKTTDLNKWIQMMQNIMQPKNKKGGKAKIKYMTQSGHAPYYFKIFPSHKLSDSYIRFLSKRFATDFNLLGLQINITQAIKANPYTSKK